MKQENQGKQRKRRRGGVVQQRDKTWLSNKKYFNKDWNDVPGVNDAQPLELAETDLMDESKGLYHRDPDTIDRANEVRDAYKVLTKREQLIIQLIGEDGKSQEEAARLLRVTRSTIQSALKVISAKIRKHIKYEKLKEEIREQYL